MDTTLLILGLLYTLMLISTICLTDLRKINIFNKPKKSSRFNKTNKINEDITKMIPAKWLEGDKEIKWETPKSKFEWKTPESKFELLPAKWIDKEIKHENNK